MVKYFNPRQCRVCGGARYASAEGKSLTIYDAPHVCTCVEPADPIVAAASMVHQIAHRD